MAIMWQKCDTIKIGYAIEIREKLDTIKNKSVQNLNKTFTLKKRAYVKQ